MLAFCTRRAAWIVSLRTTTVPSPRASGDEATTVAASRLAGPSAPGAPHRIKYLEMLYDYILSKPGVVMWTGAEILDWYKEQTR